jgi:hypothetical protein
MQSFHIGDAEFLLDTRPGAQRGTSADNQFILVKNQGCLDFYRNWAFEKPRTIMELGMFEGGSMVFLDKIFSPSRLVGLDIRRQPIAALEAYKQSRPHIKTYYGRSQDGPETLQAARENFPDGIDLVVDDASHKYPQTKAAFAMLFPLLKAGGQYVIEDWACGHGGQLRRGEEPACAKGVGLHREGAWQTARLAVRCFGPPARASSNGTVNGGPRYVARCALNAEITTSSKNFTCSPRKSTSSA